ncbi:hypothetical protein, partial [Rhizobium sp. Leaf341]|uniref:hypothetical protein n=1 Tax=Rhizobium sp. Leaf341 TaxID=1736344 RepID=UPI001AEC1763
GPFHPPETMAIIVLVAFENGSCPGYITGSDKLSYGTAEHQGSYRHVKDLGGSIASGMTSVRRSLPP